MTRSPVFPVEIIVIKTIHLRADSILLSSLRKKTLRVVYEKYSRDGSNYVLLGYTINESASVKCLSRRTQTCMGCKDPHRMTFLAVSHTRFLTPNMRAKWRNISEQGQTSLLEKPIACGSPTVVERSTVFSWYWYRTMSSVDINWIFDHFGHFILYMFNSSSPPYLDDLAILLARGCIRLTLSHQPSSWSNGNYVWRHLAYIDVKVGFIKRGGEKFWIQQKGRKLVREQVRVKFRACNRKNVSSEPHQ